MATTVPEVPDAPVLPERDPPPSQAEAVERDLGAMPENLRSSAFASIARGIAWRLDSPDCTTASYAQLSKNLIEALDRLYARMPKPREEDELDGISGARDQRLAIARGTASAA